MSRIDDPREKDIPTSYWNEVYREYALLQAVRAIAVELHDIKTALYLMRDDQKEGK